MDLDVEAASDRRRDPGPRGRRVLSPPLRDKVQDRLRALVGALGPARPGQEPGDPLAGERRVRPVEGLPTGPEGGGHGRDGPAVDAMAAHHLVLHLHVIPPIEERRLGEGLVLHALGAGMERAGRAEGGGFGVLGRRAAGGSHVTVILFILRPRVEKILRQAREIQGLYDQSLSGRGHVQLRAAGAQGRNSRDVRDEITLTPGGPRAESSRGPGGDQRGQRPQVCQAEVGAPTPNTQVGVGADEIGPSDGHGVERAVRAFKRDAVFSPERLGDNELKGLPPQGMERMGDPN